MKTLTTTAAALLVSLGTTACQPPGVSTGGKSRAATCDQVQGESPNYNTYSISFPAPSIGSGQAESGTISFDEKTDPGLHHNISLSPPNQTLWTGESCQNGQFKIYASGGQQIDTWTFFPGAGSGTYSVTSTQLPAGTATKQP